MLPFSKLNLLFNTKGASTMKKVWIPPTLDSLDFSETLDPKGFDVIGDSKGFKWVDLFDTGINNILCFFNSTEAS